MHSSWIACIVCSCCYAYNYLSRTVITWSTVHSSCIAFMSLFLLLCVQMGQPNPFLKQRLWKHLLWTMKTSTFLFETLTDKTFNQKVWEKRKLYLPPLTIINSIMRIIEQNEHRESHRLKRPCHNVVNWCWQLLTLLPVGVINSWCYWQLVLFTVGVIDNLCYWQLVLLIDVFDSSWCCE